MTQPVRKETKMKEYERESVRWGRKIQAHFTRSGDLKTRGGETDR